MSTQLTEDEKETVAYTLAFCALMKDRAEDLKAHADFILKMSESEQFSLAEMMFKHRIGWLSETRDDIDTVNKFIRIIRGEIKHFRLIKGGKP